ncbi:MAG: hypothetical protein OEW87_15800 [Flavobacteriaceae bacterium]|nr:hypothetical protein [Flavobacteriaceae bacterium]
MPRQETILKAFVASPGDVSDEREVLEGIVDELNKSWSADLGVRLELIKWETDCQPGFGEDPQDVINNQITDDYDIFIGLFWGRIGTKTLRANSGTIEEFEKAHKRYKKDPNAIDIMLYFKDAPIQPSKIDTVQLADLMKFKSALNELGGLYWSFDSMNDFEATLRTHLSATIQKWSKKHRLQQDNSAVVVVDSEQLYIDDDDYGFFDYLESFEDLNDKMCASLNNITEATEKIGENMNKRSEDMNQVSGSNEKNNFIKIKKIIKLSSEDMERYASSLEVQLPIFSSSRAGTLEALSKALVMYRDFEGSIEDLEELETNLKAMRESALESKVGILQFKKTISDLPRITSDFNRSKKHVIQVLNAVEHELDSNSQVTQNILDSIYQLKVELK